LQENALNAFFLSRELDNIEIHEQIRTSLIDNDAENRAKLASIRPEFSENTSSMCVQSIQNEWQQYHNQFVLMCRFLFEIVKHFPAETDQNSLFSSDTKNFIDFYAKICQFSCTKNKTKKFCDTEQFIELRKLLRLSSVNTCHEIASTFSKLIEVKVFTDQINYQHEFLNDLHEFCDTLTRIRANYTVSHADNSFNEEDSNEPPVFKEPAPEITSSMMAKKRMGPSSSLNRRSSIRTLKPIQENSPTKVQRRNTMCISNATQKQLAKAQSIKTIEQAKMDMFDWLSAQFGNYFDNDYGTHAPHSPFFCYSKLDNLKKRLFDVQRISTHECLLNSYGYMKTNGYLTEGFSPKNRKNLRRSPNTGRVIEDSQQSDKLLALNIVYKLYLECGHMINLYDWLQAFVEKEEGADLRELPEQKRKLYQ
jgi:hypothetical protein